MNISARGRHISLIHACMGRICIFFTRGMNMNSLRQVLGLHAGRGPKNEDVNLPACNSQKARIDITSGVIRYFGPGSVRFLQMECPPSQVAAGLPTSSVESACTTHGSHIPHAECTCSNRCGHFHDPTFPMTDFRFFTRFCKVFLVILLF